MEKNMETTRMGYIGNYYNKAPFLLALHSWTLRSQMGPKLGPKVYQQDLHGAFR